MLINWVKYFFLNKLNVKKKFFSGLVNSAYRVRGKNDDQEWTEIGRRSPQLPQMFYPTQKDVTIKQGDYVAAVCTMFNKRSHVVRIGYDDVVFNEFIK
jgi:hypothetical protein